MAGRSGSCLRSVGRFESMSAEQMGWGLQAGQVGRQGKATQGKRTLDGGGR